VEDVSEDRGGGSKVGPVNFEDSDMSSLSSSSQGSRTENHSTLHYPQFLVGISGLQVMSGNFKVFTVLH